MTTTNVALPSLTAASLQAPTSSQLTAMRQANAAAADQSFNQMLDKQLASRRESEAKANQPKPAERQPTSTPAPEKTSTATSDYDSNAAAMAANASAARLAEQASQAQRRADATSTTKSQPAQDSGGSDRPAQAASDKSDAQSTSTAATTQEDSATAKTQDSPADAAAVARAAGDLTMPADLAALVASLLKPAATSKDAAAAVPDETGNAAVKTGKTDAATLAMLNAAAGKADAGESKDITADADSNGVFAKALGETSGEKIKAAAQDHAETVATDKNLKPDADLASKLPPKAADAASAQLRVLPQVAAETRVEAGKPGVESVGATTTPATLQAVTQSAPLTTAAAAQAASTTLPQKVGSDAWNNALGQKVVWMAAGGEETATITINPPDLGPLQVVLSVSNAQANASFSSAQPEVRQALEAAMPKLREMLSDAGIQLGQASVDSGSASQQDQAARFAMGGVRGSGNQAGEDGAEVVSRAAVGRTISSGNGMVDTFA
ncbi:MAG: flagellar hook-length control protein FliK [Janthinobacterium lividum]